MTSKALTKQIKDIRILTDRQSNYPLFDYLKFFLSLMVVAIHSNLYPELLYPWLRLSLPLFFMMSSYFFFGKIHGISIEEQRLECLKGYVKRNLSLYGFWFLVLLPVTAIIRKHIFDNGFAIGVLKTIRNFLFSSTYVASWFIMAAILDVVIVFFASRSISNNKIFAFAFVVYLIVCFESSYLPFVHEDGLVAGFFAIYDKILTPSYNSFPAGLIWIALGKYFAEQKPVFNKLLYIIGIPVSAILLYAEWSVIRFLGGLVSSDCLVFLLPMSFLLFALVRQKSRCVMERKFLPISLRRLSVVLYSLHGTLIPVMCKLGSILGFPTRPAIIFLATASCCICVGATIVLLSRKQHFRWLRISF